MNNIQRHKGTEFVESEKLWGNIKSGIQNEHQINANNLLNRLMLSSIPKVRNRRQTRNPKKNSRLKKKGKKNYFTQVQGHRDEIHLPSNVGVFTKWRNADWAETLDARRRKRAFHLNMSTGELEIKFGGIYLMYAQITMTGDLNQGFEVVCGDKVIATCSVSSYAEVNETIPHEERTTSCMTMGIFPFETSSKVFIRQKTKDNVNRQAWLTASQSYFGFLRLGDLPSIEKKKGST
ncbi:hypothetical protein ScPMuIL_018366 [Solemya velum]